MRWRLEVSLCAMDRDLVACHHGRKELLSFDRLPFESS
jgi:hypothetical protein